MYSQQDHPKEGFKQYYNERWFDENTRPHPPNKERITIVAECISNAVGCLAESRILDVGCGNGWLLAALEHRLSEDHQLFGIEPSNEGVANSQSRTSRSAVLSGGLGDVEFEELFDVVVCSEVMEHVEDQESFVGYLASHVKPNGTLVITTPNGRYRGAYFVQTGAEPQPIEKWVTARGLTDLLRPTFNDVIITTFDNSYWRLQHSKMAAGLRLAWKVKGGFRCAMLIDKHQLSKCFTGLYLLATAKRKQLDEH